MYKLHVKPERKDLEEPARSGGIQAIQQAHAIPRGLGLGMGGLFGNLNTNTVLCPPVLHRSWKRIYVIKN